MGHGAGPGVTEAGGILDFGGRSGGAKVRHRERFLRLGGRTESADPQGHAASGPALPARKA
jgi:hypothetical protein